MVFIFTIYRNLEASSCCSKILILYTKHECMKPDMNVIQKNYSFYNSWKVIKLKNGWNLLSTECHTFIMLDMNLSPRYLIACICNISLISSAFSKRSLILLMAMNAWICFSDFPMLLSHSLLKLLRKIEHIELHISI